MSGVPAGLVCELLTESLVAWRVDAVVSRGGEGAILIAASKTIRIEPAGSDAMFRWMVTIDERKRGAVSLVAVLRQIRDALDPGYAASRVRIATAPLVPS